ncbi:DUF2799 domain-containing protein [Desulfopila sp. IMCC35006]|uniref:DUF2799 domain-containing protein n=1 Tax=Desulfopila sp. IMCC35006 TaxID=2569542 RepID=UPI00142EDFC1|nr:DUF2799 domain-containing protein [Desulfopila sp. IMCC35006]
MNGLKIDLSKVVNRLLAAVLFGLLVSGCAAMSKKECLNAQWQSVGFEDGAKGYQASRIGEYRTSCAEYNVAPDVDAYMQGRLQGLAQWCTPSNGYYQGTRGAVYNGVCPEALASDFEFAMSEGRAVYDYLQKIQDYEMFLARLHREYGAIGKQISSMESELVSDQVQPGRRRDLLHDIRAAERDRESLRYDISEAEFSLGEMHRNLERMKAESLYQ